VATSTVEPLGRGAFRQAGFIHRFLSRILYSCMARVGDDNGFATAIRGSAEAVAFA